MIKKIEDLLEVRGIGQGTVDTIFHQGLVGSKESPYGGVDINSLTEEEIKKEFECIKENNPQFNHVVALAGVMKLKGDYDEDIVIDRYKMLAEDFIGFLKEGLENTDGITQSDEDYINNFIEKLEDEGIEAVRELLSISETSQEEYMVKGTFERFFNRKLQEGVNYITKEMIGEFIDLLTIEIIINCTNVLDDPDFIKEYKDTLRSYSDYIKHTKELTLEEIKLLNVTNPNLATEHNCGENERTIYIELVNPEIISLGCFTGTRSEAIKAVMEKYNEKEAKEYIEKINNCFKKVAELKASGKMAEYIKTDLSNRLSEHTSHNLDVINHITLEFGYHFLNKDVNELIGQIYLDNLYKNTDVELSYSMLGSKEKARLTSLIISRYDLKDVLLAVDYKSLNGVDGLNRSLKNIGDIISDREIFKLANYITYEGLEYLLNKIYINKDANDFFKRKEILWSLKDLLEGNTRERPLGRGWDNISYGLSVDE